MTNAKLTTIAISLWLGGFAATAALAHSVNRPPSVTTHAISAEPKLEQATLTELVQAPAPPEPTRLIVLPTVEIVGKALAPAQPKATPRVMHCHAWRPLEQGSNSVQICD
jgi:hypothetical protein